MDSFRLFLEHVGVDAEIFGDAVHEHHVAHHVFVAHCYIARCLVGHVHVMSLVDKAFEGAAHGNHVVVGVGREHNHALGVGGGAFGASGVVGVGFSAGPSGDCMLEVVENLDVGLICRAVHGEEFAEAPVVVVAVGEFEDGFSCHVAEPYHGAACELVVPFARSYFPRACYAGEFIGGGEVNYYHGMCVALEI